MRNTLSSHLLTTFSTSDVTVSIPSFIFFGEMALTPSRMAYSVSATPSNGPVLASLLRVHAVDVDVDVDVVLSSEALLVLPLVPLDDAAFLTMRGVASRASTVR